MKNQIPSDAIAMSTQKELDDLVFLASQIFKTAHCSISIFKENNRLYVYKTSFDSHALLKDSPFCTHLIHSHEQSLIVTNALDDARFNRSDLVLGSPAIRFYAGIPLVTCKGTIYGTFSLMDTQPRELDENELASLEILARKAMYQLDSNQNILNKRFTPEETEPALEKAAHIPYYENVLFELTFDRNSGLFFINFLSSGFIHLYPDIDPSLKVVPPLFILERLSKLERFSATKAFLTSLQSEKEVKIEYLKKYRNGNKAWYRVIFSSEKKANGQWLVHGIVKNITYEKEYQAALKKILFDISHIIRKPITTIIGLSDLLNTAKDIPLNEKLELVNLISQASKDLEKHTLDLNSDYQDKMDSLGLI